MIGRKRSRHASRIASKGAAALLALFHERHVDHHDCVLFHDADQHQDADDGDDREVQPEEFERPERPDRRRRQPGQDGERMDEALVEDAEHDVDRDDGRGEQKPLVGERVLEHLGGSGEGSRDRGRHVQFGLDGVDAADRVAERDPGRRVEGDVTAGSCPSWLMDSGPAVRSTCAMVESGTSLPFAGARMRMRSSRSAVHPRRGSNSVMTW